MDCPTFVEYQDKDTPNGHSNPDAKKFLSSIYKPQQFQFASNLLSLVDTADVADEHSTRTRTTLGYPV